MAELNRYNFLRWYSDCTNADVLDYPKIYQRDKTSYYAPVLKVGEITKFYLNFNIAVNHTFDAFLMKDNVKVGDALCRLTQLVIGTNIFEYYGSFTTPNVPDGTYRLGLYDGNTLFSISNLVEVATNTPNTCLVAFRHTRNTFGFNYSLLPDTWYQQIRIHISEIDRQVEDQHDQYRSVTSNKLRNYDIHVDRWVKFESYFFDEGAHEAAEAMVSHEYIYINDKKFTFKEAYKRATELASATSKAEFQLYEDQFSQDQRFDNTDIKVINAIYFNEELNQAFQKNDCPEGKFGSWVNYKVKAGKYCSIVSQEYSNGLAQAEIDANGQANANKNGDCLSGSIIYHYTFDSFDDLDFSGTAGYEKTLIDGLLRIDTLPGGRVDMYPMIGVPHAAGDYRLSCRVVQIAGNDNPLMQLRGSDPLGWMGNFHEGIAEFNFTSTGEFFLTIEFSSGPEENGAFKFDDLILIKK
jgi:hypothetical protein